jgi:hypothetical protein
MSFVGSLTVGLRERPSFSMIFEKIKWKKAATCPK